MIVLYRGFVLMRWMVKMDMGFVTRWSVVESGISDDKSVCVCRGVLRFLDPRIQDSRTDFQLFSRKLIDSTSMRGWCKIEGWSGDTKLHGGCTT
jgi:hypothetical protein